ncbi:MAG: hypothetical protein Kow0013_10540 [Pararhodobacter sp.]
MHHRGLLLASLVVLGACAGGLELDESGNLVELPEGLAEMAAPGQNLRAVQIMPEDGCYWYRHENPVEVTYLPLRTVDGRPICSRPQ